MSTTSRFRGDLLRALVLLVVSSSCTAAFGQDKQYTQNKPDLAMRSDAHIDPSTLAMSLEIPLAGAPGRAGTGLPIALRYSSKAWRINYSMSWWSYISYNTWTRAKFSENATAGWTSSLEPPRIEFTGMNQLFDTDGNPLNEDGENPPNYACYVRRINVHLPDGSSHELRRDDTPQCFYRDSPNYDFSGSFYAVDGSNMRYDNDAGVLYMPDGGRYFFGVQQAVYRYQGELLDGRWATGYTDRNGNTLNYNSSTRVWTDTLGRSYGELLPDNPTDTVNDQLYYVPGFNGQLTYRLRWRRLADVLSNQQEQLRYTSNTHCTNPQQYESRSPYLFTSSYPARICADNDLFNPIVLGEVELPNGKKYELKYNPWGEIDKVIFPTGGYERFRYDMVSTIADITDPYDQGNRGVVERWVSPSGNGSEESTHHSQYSITRTGGNLTATSTLPNGTRSERLVYVSSTAFNGFDNPLAGMTYDERVFDSGNQMLRRTLTEWSLVTPTGSSQPRNPHVTKNVNLLMDTGGNALGSTATFQHDADLNVIATSKYDFASVDQSTAQTGAISSIQPGALVRTEEATYLVNDSNIDANTRAAYRARNLLSLPTSTRVKNSAGSIVAQSSISYDEAAYPVLSYGGITGWTDPATGLRGNATTTASWLNTTGAWLQTHAQYDQCGSLRNIWDAKGNQSQVEYSSAYYYAYPTLTRTAVPDPNGQALVSTTAYDFNSGLVTSTTDANNQTTTFEYYDSLSRLTRTVHADQSQTSVSYDDYNHIVTTTSDLTNFNDNLLKGQSLFDGLGRAIETRQYEGSTNYIATQQQYDSMGRVFKTSNPFRPWQSESAVWTTTGFDALSRVVSVTTPDNAVFGTSYSGNTVTVTDQAGKKRRSVTDGLGRLKEVYEDPAGQNYLTSYGYDVLDNLTNVSQGVQTRTFVYDSLKRLTSATNPESGIITYQYDNNGNLTQKTDARVPAVTTTYAYDALNRATTRTYSDGTSAVTYAYDAGSVANSKGRLTSVSSSVSTYSYSSYDAVGRVVGGTQTLGGQSYTVGYTYDKAGHVLTETYPSQRTVTNTYDNAGRTESVNGNLGDGAIRTYANDFQYTAWNGLQQEKFGTDTALYHKQRYNLRGQLWDIRASTVPFNTDAANGDRGAIVNYYSNSFVAGGSGTDNNGNLVRQETYIPGSNFFQDNHTYDSLNRLAAVSEKLNGVGNDSFKQAYAYDRWGNRTIDTVNTVNATAPQFDANDFQNTNRLYAPGDTALPMNQRQMQYDGAGNLTYDAYTGQGTRTYDGENRMKQAWANGQWQTYSYDGDGRRVKRIVTVSGTQTETWQVYGINGELLAEYAANASALSPQKEYGYRNGQLLVEIMAAGGSGWGSPPSFTDNPLAAGVVVKALHITQLRTAINDLRGHMNKGAYQWQYSATTNDWISANPILEMRAALDDALGQPTPAYSAGLAQGQPIKAIHIQELRDRVLAAWGSGSGGVDIRWLVTDHLGTPRMIVDKSGTLSGVSRHDYLPFGEELFANAGGRTTGYTNSDGARQKFTQKERDNETGLDYFLARYYSSAQGRFTSPDEFTGGPDELYYFVDDASANPTFYADLRNPQSLNKYQYAYNNPLRYVDPDGHDADEADPDPDPPQGQGTKTSPYVGPSISPITPEQAQQTIEALKALNRWIDEQLRPTKEIIGTATPDTIDPIVIAPTVPVPAPKVGPMPPPPPAQARPHRKGKRKSTEQEHEEGMPRSRPGRPNTKDRLNPNWKPRQRPPGWPKNKPWPPWKNPRPKDWPKGEPWPPKEAKP